MHQKNLQKREGWVNRHLNELPNKECEIIIIYEDFCSKNNDELIEKEICCLWKPYSGPYQSPENVNNNSQLPFVGYLGTAWESDANKLYITIGFHVWKQNDSSFVYYKIIEKNENE